MSDPAPAPPDPLKGLRGVYAAILVLESIAVALSMLVLPKDDPGTNSIAITLITGLTVLMVVAAGLQRRPWGLGLALGLQVATIVVGLVLLPALAVMGVVFAVVWGGILWMRRDVQARMARGELPSQQRAGTDPDGS
ncbi:DUF4233 domain-containing protein [Pseudonocardia humida]|uniref:DUF4233 domain-containing protein n=1 Tax=Pseudonocardia humida TaxID=2800819 RepID=A0ABT1A0P2_9PSEU|nr:DUF4233 domain-containing protein [Pseudonocardia humida]MCO1656559.1 DUF4233 domain-containing protein [Pseudonocardia humida]